MDFEFEDLFRHPHVCGPDTAGEASVEAVHDTLSLSESDSEEDGRSGGAHAPATPSKLEDFTILRHVGEGAFGRVYQVKENETGEIYALKLLKKHHLFKVDAIRNTRAERDILWFVGQ